MVRRSRKWVFAITFIGIAAVAAAAVLKQRRAENVPGPAVTRLLTADQYRNIVADVFGDDIDLGGRLEPDLRADGLLAVGAAQVSIAPAGMEQYDAMARAVANQILDANHRAGVLPCRPATAAAFDEPCARAFLAKAGRLLYRRPLTQPELDAYVKAARIGTQISGGFYDGVGLSVAG